MIETSQDEFSEDERNWLEESLSKKNQYQAGCISSIAYYGMYLLLLPFVLAGAINAPFILFGIHNGYVVALCFGVGLILGVLRLRKDFQQEKSLRLEFQDLREEDIRFGHFEVTTITEITAAWVISDLEDFGPGYLLRTEQNEWFYLASQQLLDFEEEEFPTETVEIRHLTATRLVDRVVAEGKGIEVSGEISLAKLPMNILKEFQVIPSDEVSTIIQIVESSPE